MKKLILSAFAIFLFNNAHAVQYNNILLPMELNRCVNSLELKFSIHSERIKRDEEALLGSVSYYVDPFRNIRRSMRQAEVLSRPCAKDLTRFMDSANSFYQTYGVYAVFGEYGGLRYFSRMPQYFHSGR